MQQSANMPWSLEENVHRPSGNTRATEGATYRQAMPTRPASPGAAVPPAGPAPLWEAAIFCSMTPTGRCGGAEPSCGCCGVTNKSAAPSLPLPRALSLR